MKYKYQSPGEELSKLTPRPFEPMLKVLIKHNRDVRFST